VFGLLNNLVNDNNDNEENNDNDVDKDDDNDDKDEFDAPGGRGTVIDLTCLPEAPVEALVEVRDV